ncbi:RtcB family protein, partial [candidate division KSB1 bacterium]|nr:RtcB family protein [candidate division KSB1 bacterium]
MVKQSKLEIKRIDDYRWELPKQGGMRVPGKIFADKRLMDDIHLGQSIQQVANVAHLPGILSASLAMPDIHWGYGFPIGGVAAMDAEEGVISPGGVGYDINCGVRFIRTSITRKEIMPKMRELVNSLYNAIPTGVGSSSSLKLTIPEEKRLLTR